MDRVYVIKVCHLQNINDIIFLRLYIGKFDCAIYSQQLWSQNDQLVPFLLGYV